MNQKRLLSAGNSILRDVLEGGMTRWDESINITSHMDPVRLKSEYAKLVQSCLDSTMLSQQHGLSTLLAWMGTGQGEGTASFLRILQERGKSFAFSTLKECIDAFFEGIKEQQSWINDNPDLAKLPYNQWPKHGFLMVDDSTIWGQPSPHLRISKSTAESVSPQRDHLMKKFEPYFSANVRNKWKLFLQGSAGSLPSWSEATLMIRSLELPGFGRISKRASYPLTTMQMAHNMAILGLCAEPLLEEMADYISKCDKGAKSGLDILGFRVQSLPLLKTSFLAIHTFLDHFLTCSDKETLGFGIMFTEHLLHSVACWVTRLKGAMDLQKEGNDEAQLQMWEPGANLNRSDLYPIPLKITRSQLAQILSEYVDNS